MKARQGWRAFQRYNMISRFSFLYYRPIMRPTPVDLVRRARTPGYLVMALLILSPLIELCAAAWPFQVRQAAWRLSFVGTAGASLGVPILGLFLTFLLAVLVADRTAMWLVSIFSVVGGLLCFLEAGIFSLDALQMKAHVRAALIERYDVVSAWWLIKLCVAGGILFVMAVTSFRAAKHVRRESALGSEKSAAWLVSSADLQSRANVAPPVPSSPAD